MPLRDTGPAEGQGRLVDAGPLSLSERMSAQRQIDAATADPDLRPRANAAAQGLIVDTPSSFASLADLLSYGVDQVVMGGALGVGQPGAPSFERDTRSATGQVFETVTGVPPKPLEDMTPQERRARAVGSGVGQGAVSLATGGVGGLGRGAFELGSSALGEVAAYEAERADLPLPVQMLASLGTEFSLQRARDLVGEGVGLAQRRLPGLFGGDTQNDIAQARLAQQVDNLAGGDPEKVPAALRSIHDTREATMNDLYARVPRAPGVSDVRILPDNIKGELSDIVAEASGGLEHHIPLRQRRLIEGWGDTIEFHDLRNARIALNEVINSPRATPTRVGYAKRLRRAIDDTLDQADEFGDVPEIQNLREANRAYRSLRDDFDSERGIVRRVMEVENPRKAFRAVMNSDKPIENARRLRRVFLESGNPDGWDSFKRIGVEEMIGDADNLNDISARSAVNFLKNNRQFLREVYGDEGYQTANRAMRAIRGIRSGDIDLNTPLTHFSENLDRGVGLGSNAVSLLRNYVRKLDGGTRNALLQDLSLDPGTLRELTRPVRSVEDFHAWQMRMRPILARASQRSALVGAPQEESEPQRPSLQGVPRLSGALR